MLPSLGIRTRLGLALGILAAMVLAADPEASDKARQLVAEMLKVEQAYGPVATSIVELALGQHREQAITRMNDDCRPLLAALVRATSAYAEYTEARTQGLQHHPAAGRSRVRGRPRGRWGSGRWHHGHVLR